MSYQAPSGTVEGELVLKRQYAIEEGALENILDIPHLGAKLQDNHRNNEPGQ